MPRAGVYVLASLISGVSAALILASSPSYTDARSPRSTAYNVNRGQATYNGCRSGPCQIAYLNSLEDFCLWAPSHPVLSATGNTEHTLVAWCMKSAHGTRLIPDGTISGARLVITPEYVQITGRSLQRCQSLIVKRSALGVGDLTNINVPADGVASASGEGDRVHDLVFTRAYGQLEQIYDWTSFVSQERFCFRACKPSAAASTTCTRIHDIFGCSGNIPGNYDSGVFDALEVPATLYQEVLAAPTRPLSGYTTCGTIGDAQVARARRAITSTSGSTSSALVTSYRHRLSTTLTSSVAPTTTDTATTVTFPSPPTSTLTAAAFTNSISSTPVSFATPTSTPYSYSYSHIHSHWHSDTYRHSRHRSSTSSASVSSSSSHHSWTYSRSSSSTAPSLTDPPSTSSATPSFTFTFSFSTYSSLDPSSSLGTSTTTSTPIPASTAPTATSFFSSSSDGTSSSGVSSYQSSSTATPTSSPTSPPTSPSTSSQSSDVLTFTTSYVSSSVPITSTATSQYSQTQLGSQCPPPSQNAGSVVPLPAPLFPLMLTILMIVLSSSVGALVL